MQSSCATRRCGSVAMGAHSAHPQHTRASCSKRVMSGSFVHSGSATRTHRRQALCRAVAPEFKEALDKFLMEHKVTAFIKGTRDFPQCGFSNTVVQILNRMEVPYETVDILADDSLRSGMKEYSEWPTFPQVYIDAEFYGGCDIMLEAYSDGTLKEELERVMLE